MTKWCKFCEKEHPVTADYYFLNGGVFRKCKVHYSKYEQARYRKRRDKALAEKQTSTVQLLDK